MARYRSTQEHIVMGGAPRSGTTLLRKLLDRHPDVRSGPETKLFVPAAFNLAWLAEAYGIPRSKLDAMRRDATSQAAFIDAFASCDTGASGKRRWAEKTPQNIRHLDWITQRFPRASLLHIMRDGRDVICSMRQHPDWCWVDGAWQKVLVPRPLDWYARRWLTDTSAGMAWRGDARYVEVRYEDLVADPVEVLRDICERIGVPAEEGWLRRTAGPESGAAGLDAAAREVGGPDYDGAVSDASVGRWRAELSPGEQEQIERICGPRLRELGYET